MDFLSSTDSKPACADKQPAQLEDHTHTLVEFPWASSTEPNAVETFSLPQFPWTSVQTNSTMDAFSFSPPSLSTPSLLHKTGGLTRSVAFNGDGSVLWMISKNRKHEVHAYDTATGLSLYKNMLLESYDICAVVRRSPQEREMLLLYSRLYKQASDEASIHLYRIKDTYELELDQRMFDDREDMSDPYAAIRASPSGTRLILVSSDLESVYLWDWEKRTRRGPLPGAGGTYIVDVGFFSDFEAASLSTDRSFRVWDVASGACKASFTIAKTLGVSCMVCLPMFDQERRILVGSGSSLLQRFVLRGDVFIEDLDGVLDGSNRDVICMAYSPSSDVIAFGTKLTFLSANMYAPALKSASEQLSEVHALFTITPLIDLVREYLRPLSHASKRKDLSDMAAVGFDFSMARPALESATNNAEALAVNAQPPMPEQKVLRFNFASNHMYMDAPRPSSFDLDEEPRRPGRQLPLLFREHYRTSVALPPSLEFADLNLDFSLAFPPTSDSASDVVGKK